jgi:ribosomal protection tetracycline resistance protein
VRTVNLGILAHVDAGKTTLTEQLLFAAGIIDEVGSVDAGSTQTDFLDLERQRGITIKAAVVSFMVGDVAVNLIDTPGHPDFIAEIERVLGVLDGAVLVVSAVEGVQPQTRILMRTLKRLGIPTLLFVNKIDRTGAAPDQVVLAISEKLTQAVVVVDVVREAGTRNAASAPADLSKGDFRTRSLDVLADHDDEILARVMDGREVSDERLERALERLSRRGEVHPVLFGSALTGQGVDRLMHAITRFLPTGTDEAEADLEGSVFKIERGPKGEQLAYVRLFSGSLRVRDKLRVHDEDRKVSRIEVFDQGGAVVRSEAHAGQIAKVWGLSGVRIGDELGGRDAARPRPREHFDPPTLEAVVEPRRASDAGALYAALVRLAEQDPLIDVRRDDVRREMSVSLYGQVQQEVIQATLANDFGIDVAFRETTMICVERPLGPGDAVEEIGDDNPFLAAVGIRIEPAAIGSGVSFHLAAPLNTVPLYVYGSVEEFATSMRRIVDDTFAEGLRGWRVVDCNVTMTRSDYRPPGTGRRDFRYLAPLVLMAALRAAGTAVCEPVHRYRLEIPGDTLGIVAQALARSEAATQSIRMGATTCELEGHIAAVRLHDFYRLLPGLTQGEGLLESVFDHYRPIRGEQPTRPRTDRDPLNRGEYLRRVLPRY